METTRNELPKNVKHFFHELSEYLETKLLYFGSVQRSDYVPGKSDIDVDVFAENEYSLMIKMQHFLHVQKKDFQKVAWILRGEPIYGYKLKYENQKEGIIAEFSIYNEKFKPLVLAEHNNKHDLPIYTSILLYFLKLFYYQLNLLDKKTYGYYKRVVLNGTLGEEIDAKYLVLNSR
jgi:predicted nucleotidyltransferase